jgi:hypothetical protein
VIGAKTVRSFAARFGVPEVQVERDHLVSHVLAALPTLGEDVTFFGGTALCRTHLLDWRLSEDIDLLVDAPSAWRRTLAEQLPRTLRREFPGARVDWSRGSATATSTGRLVVEPGVIVQLQLVARDDGYRRYPTERREVALRYPDLASDVILDVPTAVGAVAMKLNAWAERAAPRDLCDLYGFVLGGGITEAGVETARAVTHFLEPGAFARRRCPTEEQWLAALGAQMAEVPPLETVFGSVRKEVRAAAGWHRFR